MTGHELATSRFSENYKTAQTLTKAGRLISTVALILVFPFAIAGLDVAGQEAMSGALILWGLAGMMALIGYGVGRAVTAQGHILGTSIDQAVNTCTLLTDLDREEIMSLHASQPWRQLGIQYPVQPAQQATSSARRFDEELPFHSPIATLIASSPISAHFNSAPFVRCERHLARFGRRRSR